MSTLDPSVASLVALLWATAMLTSAQPSPIPVSLPEAEIQETYAAYSALIRQELGTRDAAKVLISKVTRGGHKDASCMKPPVEEHETEYKDQISKYLERNRVSYQLVAKFDIGRTYELVIAHQTEATPRPIYISLSAVGFNASMDRAVVYMEYAGMGSAFFLTKKGGKWKVDFERMPRTCGWIA